jgi:hypothetical protein
MGLERRIQRLEALYNASSAGEEPGREERERELLEKLEKVREKATAEEQMGDPRRMHALKKLEAFLKWRQDQGLSE